MPNLNRTVVLQGDLGERREERRAAEAIDPGDLIEVVTTTGTVQRNDKVAGTIQVMVALEDPYQSRTVADAYASGDLVSYHIAKPGDLLYLRVPAAAAAIVVGDSLEAAANGVVQKLAAGVRRFIAESAIDNSAGGSKEWVKARVI